jgi:hypothetical protein
VLSSTSKKKMINAGKLGIRSSSWKALVFSAV